MSKDLTKKSGIIYLSVFLFLVCAVATALMSFAAVMTDKPIADRQKALIAGTLKRVLPPFETVTEQKAENGSTVYTALDAGGKTVGYAVLCTTQQGYPLISSSFSNPVFCNWFSVMCENTRLSRTAQR